MRTRLFRLTSPAYRLPFHVDYSHRVITSNGANIPTVTWPDGHWCFEANSYLLALVSKNLSRKYKGGTLAAYARNIGHFLRFCSKNRFDVVDVSDSLFTMFMWNLVGERSAKDRSRPARSAATVIAIGRQCLSFIEFVGRLYGLQDLVGPRCRIIAKRKSIAIFREAKREKGASGKSVVQTFWTHHSFPTPSPKDKRFAISSDSIDKLLDAVAVASPSMFLRKRRYALVKVLQIGGRRSEVAALTVASVRNAAAMAEPALQLLCAKRPGGAEAYRYLPIAHHELASLIEYIEVNRKPVIRNTCGAEGDSGILLVNERTGRGLTPNTITAEIAMLRVQAGFSERAHPHMFRHRFAQMDLASLLQEMDLQRTDDGRMVPPDMERLLLRVSQRLGQTNPESARSYLRDAFTEYTKFEKTCDAAQLRSLLASANEAFKQMEREMVEATSPKDALEDIRRFLLALRADIEQAALKRRVTST